jgi:hypothetical protein
LEDSADALIGKNAFVFQLRANPCSAFQELHLIFHAGLKKFLRCTQLSFE